VRHGNSANRFDAQQIADGASLPMIELAAPSLAFPVRVCIAAIPTAAQYVSAGGLDLPVPIAKPRHIVLFGDTGCRLKAAVVQDCNDENFWPFRKVADHAAMEHPDLMTAASPKPTRDEAARAWKAPMPRC
jgi:hypothetical protein